MCLDLRVATSYGRDPYSRLILFRSTQRLQTQLQMTLDTILDQIATRIRKTRRPLRHAFIYTASIATLLDPYTQIVDAQTVPVPMPTSTEPDVIHSVRLVHPPGLYVRAKQQPQPSIALPDSLVEIAQLYPMGRQVISFGDTDHDGQFEAVFRWDEGGLVWHYKILEEQGSNLYTEELTGADLIPYAIADLDEDGLAEIIGQVGGYIQIYESVDASSYPTQLVWTSPYLINVEGFTATGDTDRDGKQEIIHSVNWGSSLYIFENTGDNAYALVFSTHTGDQDDGEKVIADFDGDGLLEIAFSGTHGMLHIFESPGDNVWEETFTDSTGLLNAYGAAGGIDTDGNGIPELFIAGDGYLDYRKQTLVLEPVANDQFAQIATLLTEDYSAGGAHNAIGDLHGTGDPMYVLEAKDGVWVYDTVGVHQWEVCSFLPDPTTSGLYTGIQVFDVNKNGRGELFWNSFWRSTVVFEYPTTTSGVYTGEMRNVANLSLTPNPCRTHSTILFSPLLTTATRLSVYNIAGRLVDRRSLISLYNGAALWEPMRLPTGAYILRLEDAAGTALAHGRATVLH